MQAGNGRQRKRQPQRRTALQRTTRGQKRAQARKPHKHSTASATPLKTAHTASAVQFTQAPTPTKTGIVLHNDTAVGKAYKNAKMSIKTSEKKLAMQFRRVYYKLASNEGGSLRTGRSPHNRQLGQLSLKFLTIKKSSRRDKK